MKTFMELSANIVQSFLEVWFISQFCGYKYQGAKRIAAFAAVWALSVAVISLLNYIVPYDGILSLISVMIWVVYANMFLKKDKYTHIFVPVFALLTIFTANGILMFAVSYITNMSFLTMIQNESDIRMFTLTMGRAAEFLVYSGILCISGEYRLKVADWIMVTAVSFLTWAAITIFTNAALIHSDINGYMLGASIISGVVNVLIYYFIIKIHSDTELESENALLKMQNENMKNRENSLKIIYDAQRALKHDLEKHFLVLRIMAANEENNDIVKYIDNTALSKLSLSYTPLFTGNEIFNAVMNARMDICTGKGIYVNCSADDEAVSAIAPEDTAVLFGNIMDNAIEAAEKTEKKYIRLDIRNRGLYVVISLRNSFDGEFSGDLGTTKKDKSSHGYGMKNVRRAAENYDGMVECYCDNDIFCCDILLKRKDAEQSEE